MPAKITIEDVMAKVREYGAQCRVDGTGHNVQHAYGAVRWTLFCFVAQIQLDASNKIDDTINQAVNQALIDHITGE